MSSSKDARLGVSAVAAVVGAWRKGKVIGMGWDEGMGDGGGGVGWVEEGGGGGGGVEM